MIQLRRNKYDFLLPLFFTPNPELLCINNCAYYSAYPQKMFYVLYTHPLVDIKVLVMVKAV